MKCYLCGEDLKTRGAGSRKVGGVWIHRLCPAEAIRRKIKKKEKRDGKRGV